jgi:hypothetical protein
MHPTDRSLEPVIRQVRLRDHGLETVIFELVLAEASSEEAAIVLVSLKVDHERT